MIVKNKIDTTDFNCVLILFSLSFENATSLRRLNSTHLCVIAAPKRTRTTSGKGKKDAEITPKESGQKEAPIPLFAGSNVFVSKAQLAKAYVRHPAIYTSRVADMVIGKEELKQIALGKSQPDKEKFQAIIST